jgi:hypothetical protein
MTPAERNRERLQHILEKSADELAADPATRVLSLSSVESGTLTKRLWRCRLSLDLDDGRRLGYTWMNSAKYSIAHHQAKAGLQRVLGGRLISR